MKPEAYFKLPLVEWDGKSLIYSDTKECYYRDFSEAECDLEEGQTLFDLQLMPCKAQYPRLLDFSYFGDDIDYWDGSLPLEMIEAIDKFNYSIKNIIIYWYPYLGRFDVE